MKRILFYILTFLICFFQTLCANAEPAKVFSTIFDDSSALIFINMTDTMENRKFRYIPLQNPNRIYFDIEDAVLIGEKQQLVFEKSEIKEIRLAQFSTAPDIVRAVITFEEGFDTSKIKLFSVNGNIIVKAKDLKLNNSYHNTVYSEENIESEYSNIVANSQAIQKVPINVETNNTTNNVLKDIQQAFENTTLANSNGQTYDSVVSLDLSSKLKLRTKYFINAYYVKNQGLLVSGLGQLSTAKMFYLDSPKRMVIDLPNSFVDKKYRNKELMLCPDGSCKDSAKIGQNEFNKARIVVTSDNAHKYMPIYSGDMQSLLLINSDKLSHTALVSVVSNLYKSSVKKINSDTSEVNLEFTTPIVHSFIRTDDYLTLFIFNVRNYNEQDLVKTLNGTAFKKLTFSLLPQIGIRAQLPISKNDVVKIEQGVDGKSLKIVLKQSGTIKSAKPVETTSTVTKQTPKNAIKNKVVLDPGHGGSDYGAIREGINEKDIALDVSKKVASILKSKGYKVAMTRNEDVYVTLQDRVEFSENETPEIFVSIHVNSAVATEPKGIETHYYHDYSKELAQTINAKMAKAIDTKDRGLFKSMFYVINHTTVPAVLVEMGFISNPEERAELVTEKRKQATAKAIADGIMEYLKGNKK